MALTYIKKGLDRGEPASGRMGIPDRKQEDRNPSNEKAAYPDPDTKQRQTSSARECKGVQHLCAVHGCNIVLLAFDY